MRRWHHRLRRLALIAFGVVAGVWASTASASACRDFEEVTVEGREFLADDQSYNLAKEAAIFSATLSAIRIVNPVGYSGISALNQRASISGSGDVNSLRSISRSAFERARGLTRSSKVLNEEITAQAGLVFLSVELEIEVCIEDVDDTETVIALGKIYWLDGSPTSLVRSYVLANFPQTSDFVLISEIAGQAFSDVEITGKVHAIEVRSLERKPGFFNSSGFDRDDFIATRVAPNRRLPSDSEYVEVAAAVVLNAKLLASHRVIEKQNISRTIYPLKKGEWAQKKDRWVIQQIVLAFKRSSQDILKQLELQRE